MKTSLYCTRPDHSRYTLEVEISATGVRGADFFYSWHELDFRLGGSRQDLLFLKKTSVEDSCYLRLDRSLYNFLYRLQIPQMQLVLDLKKKNKNREIFIIATLFVILCSLIGGVFVLKRPLVRQVAGLIPYKYEQKIGERLLAATFPGNQLHEVPEVTELFAGPLRKIIPQEYQNFNVFIVSNLEVNAFAFPGGYIILNSGLFHQASSSEQILGVLAHELAHVTERHGLTALIEKLSLFSLVSLFLGDISGVVAILIDTGSQLLNLSFSRSVEKEADDIALEYLYQLGVSSQALLDFFSLLQKREKKSYSFISTHPLTSERIERLEKKDLGPLPSTKISLPLWEEVIKLLPVSLQKPSISP